jgi:hypothetical protein
MGAGTVASSGVGERWRLMDTAISLLSPLCQVRSSVKQELAGDIESRFVSLIEMAEPCRSENATSHPKD